MPMDPTEGRWRWSADRKAILSEAGEQIMWPARAKKDPENWAEALGAFGLNAERDAEANARAMVVAGEMLAALELLQGYDFRLEPERSADEHSNEIRRRVVAAIDLARGRR